MDIKLIKFMTRSHAGNGPKGHRVACSTRDQAVFYKLEDVRGKIVAIKK